MALKLHVTLSLISNLQFRFLERIVFSLPLLAVWGKLKAISSCQSEEKNEFVCEIIVSPLLVNFKRIDILPEGRNVAFERHFPISAWMIMGLEKTLVDIT